MNISFHYVSLIDFLALVQGVLLGIILIGGNRSNRPSLFLGLFLLSYSIELLPSILEDSSFIESHPQFLFLPIRFLFLSPLLLYLYAKSLTQAISLTSSWPAFIPAALEVMVMTGLVIFLKIDQLDGQERIRMINGYQVYFYVGILYATVYSLMTIRFIHRHQKRVMDYFSNTKNKHLKWVKGIAVFLILFGLSWFVPLFLPDFVMEEVAIPFLSSINVIFIFWVGLSGLRQPSVDIQVEASTPKVIRMEPSINGDKQDEIFQSLKQIMREEQLYKEPDLTLPTLAKRLNMTRRNLSQLINQKTGGNFNLFINQYRIEEAKRLLSDSSFDHLNMLGIAMEAGFNSKATFFAVFKKIEGLSPGAYKQQHVQ
ncbi:MAG: helix-turn-helix domain-containing protein [Bacteroidota bacterium]